MLESSIRNLRPCNTLTAIFCMIYSYDWTTRLKNACQPLFDANKVKMRVSKIALLTLKDQTARPLQVLAVNA